MKRAQPTALLIMLAAASGLAAAAPEDENKDLLRGPKVVDSAKPAGEKPADTQSMSDAMQEAGENQADERPIVMREYIAAFRALTSGRAGDKLNLSQQQADQIEAITQTHREAMRQFQEENREKLRAMRDAAGIGPRARQQQAQDDDAQPTQETDEQRQAREEERRQRHMQVRQELHDIVDNAPPSLQALARIKSVLSEEQNQMVEEFVKSVRQRRQENAKNGQRAERGERGPRGERDDRPARRMDRARRGKQRGAESEKTDSGETKPADDEG